MRRSPTATSVPASRIRPLNDAPVSGAGRYVLYWMTAFRRPGWSFALERAAAWARDLGKPLVVLEPLRCDYRWASARHHRFVLDGMRDNARAFASRGVAYYPYVEPVRGAGRGLLETMAASACVVIADDSPAFFLPRMREAAAGRVKVKMEAVDANGILPLAATQRIFPTAYAFRRFLQRELPELLMRTPKPDPLAGAKLPAPKRLALPLDRWPAADDRLLAGDAGRLSAVQVSQAVHATSERGGATAARGKLREFIGGKLARYGEDRNHPAGEATSGLSPHLHFGHISPHEIVAEVLAAEGFSPGRLSRKADGRRAGWWGLSPAAEGFLDQVITWRELGFNMAAHEPDYDRYDTLPGWARKTLADHARDRREHVYTLRQFEAAVTHDPLWNAAQTQLLEEGRIHNYLRMLWGKKILEWSPGPREALDVMVELNNKYALDGRDPNSYSGILWCLGRHARPWGPERPIFGKIRYMSSDNTRRKMDVGPYLGAYTRFARES